MICKLFRKKRHTPEPIILPDVENIKLALLVGHNKNAQGASNYLKESEFIYNSRIARKLQIALDDVNFPTAVLFRPDDGSYGYQCRHVKNQCLDLGITHVISLHFNAYRSPIDGCEVLIADTQTDVDNKLADSITDKLEFEFGIKQRHDNGVNTLDRDHRGAGMLYGLVEAGILAVILEPLFANFRSNKSTMFFESEDLYVDLLKRSVTSVLK